MVNVNPANTWPPAPVTSTSTDGILSALVDEVWAGVHLKADFTGQARIPHWCVFVRTWDGQNVRGGDRVPVVDGVAYSYDHEVLLGRVSTWYAIPIYLDGTSGSPTGVVPKTVAEPVGGTEDPSTWIKSLNDPEMSMQVMIDSWPSFSLDQQATTMRPTGRVNSIVSYGVMGGMTTEAKFRTMTKVDYDRFLALMEVGGTLLFQTAASYNRPTFYAVCTNVTPEDQARYWQAQVTWTLSLTQVDRPATEGQQPSTPGRNFSDRLAQYPTFSDVPVRTFADSRPF